MKVQIKDEDNDINGQYLKYAVNRIILLSSGGQKVSVQLNKKACLQDVTAYRPCVY